MRAIAASAMPVLPDDGSMIVWPGQQVTVLLGLLDHRLGDAVLDRAERVLALELGEDPDVGVRREGDTSTIGVLPIRSSTLPLTRRW